jgi:hypothetical protein
MTLAMYWETTKSRNRLISAAMAAERKPADGVLRR